MKPLPRSLRYRRPPLVVPPPIHNHPTRDVKPPGVCPACDTARLDTKKPGVPME